MTGEGEMVECVCVYIYIEREMGEKVWVGISSLRQTS